MLSPRVAIITPLHNGSRYIERAVQSVRSQTYANWVHIIINDRSTDGGDEIARRLAADDPRVLVIDSPGPGAATARNAGMTAADSDYVAFLDCDDLWHPQKLALQLDLMSKYDLAFTWCAYEVVDEGGRTVRTQQVMRKVNVRDLLTKRAVIGCLTAVYDRRKLGTTLMPLIRMRQDMCLFAMLLERCASEGYNAMGLDRPLAKYQVHSRSMTRNKLRAAIYQWRAYRAVFKLPLDKALLYFLHYVANGIMDRTSRSDANPLTR